MKWYRSPSVSTPFNGKITSIYTH